MPIFDPVDCSAPEYLVGLLPVWLVPDKYLVGLLLAGVLTNDSVCVIRGTLVSAQAAPGSMNIDVYGVAKIESAW